MLDRRRFLLALLSGTSPFAFGGVEPAYLLDFVNDPQGAESALTFSRASNAMMRNSSGEWVSVGVNEPRIGHHEWNGSEWVNKGLLKEGQATNLQPSSNDISDTDSWSLVVLAGIQPVGSGSLTDVIEVPDGTISADFVAETSGSGLHYWYGFVLSSAATRVWSVHLKAGSRTQARIQLGAVGMSKGVYANVDLIAGTISDPVYVDGTYTALKSGIEYCGNGWYRCFISAVCPAEDHVGYVSMLDNGATSYTGNGSGLYQWGAQMESGQVPSSLIPTNGSAATRAADVMTQPAGTLPWSASALSLFMVGEVSGDSYTLLSWQADASNYITHALNASDFTFTQAAAGTVDSITGGSHTSGLSVPFSYTATHTSTGIYAAVNGSALTPDETPTALADLTGAATSLLPSGNYTIAAIAGWAVDIGDTGRLEGSNYGA